MLTPKMNRHIRRIRNKLPIWRENRTGEIQSFLDIRRDRRLLEHATHLVRHGHEAVPED
jgi:hypothetical protein